METLLNKKHNCRCNNCEQTFFDYSDEYNISELKMFIDDDVYFKGCPNCETDTYLMDI